MSQTLTQKLGSLFYIVSPNATMFEHVSEIPNYVDDAGLIFSAFMLFEAIIRWFQGKEIRFNESLCSLGIGILHEATIFFSGTVMFFGYEWLYQYRFLTLPWNSLYTWFAAFVFIDFIYYWIHRANHEINILWVAHQVHHSSEDYNLTVAVRLSVFQRAAYLGFYQPLALLGFPFTMVIVHAAFNYLFQFWVHTDLFKNTGPLGYIIMSPSHHRVHHGSNKWCLDKNYASVFVLWDRIFGTFEPEREEEEIVYGLTDQPQSHSAIYMEFFYFKIIYEKVKSMSTWGDKLKALFYGPGWAPGTHRLGDPDTFPDIKAPRAKYDPSMPLWTAYYLIAHSFLLFLAQQLMNHQLQNSSWATIITFLGGIFISVGVFGGIIDKRWWAPLVETARCAAYIAYASTTPVTEIPLVNTALMTYFSASMLLWTCLSIQVLSVILKQSLKRSKLE